MIPHILHQTWKSKTDLPELFRQWQKTFIDLNPGLDYRLYDDDDNRALLERTFPQLLPMYDSFPREIFRVDFIRPIYLFTAGGFYADMDFQCLQPLAKVKPEERDLVLGRMGTDDTFMHSIPNAIMASAPNQGFWLGFLASIETSWKKNRKYPGIGERPEYVTGPVMLRGAVKTYFSHPDAYRELSVDFARRHKLDLDFDKIQFGKLDLFPGHVFYPVSWNDKIHRQFLKRAFREKEFTTESAASYFPSSIAVTYWTNSWQLGDPDPATRDMGGDPNWRSGDA